MPKIKSTKRSKEQSEDLDDVSGDASVDAVGDAPGDAVDDAVDDAPGDADTEVRLVEKRVEKRVRNLRKPPPEGYEDIQQTLEEYKTKMQDAVGESHEGKRKAESLWPIMRIAHARTRYIYELYYEREAISKELYDYLLKKKYADPHLIAKWKKSGYEKLCCLRCIQSKESNNEGSTCICRVPKAQVRPDTVVECVHCGCRGCSSDS